ncbi:hypothetical protein JCM10207_002183 [Rhodosporidiobolus poonsookiae]
MAPSADLLVSASTPISTAGSSGAVDFSPPPPAAQASQAPPIKPGLRKPRNGAACTRCRRYRQKCLHEIADKKKPVAPCEGCLKAGVGASCEFVPRGQSAADRSGFIAESVFLEKLEKEPESVSTFLLLSILTISARFVPSLVKRFGSRRAVTEAFSARAFSLVPNEMLKPSLERTQAFFLLGVSEWGNGNGQRSWMLLGLAVRMAGLLRLHREDSFKVSGDDPDEVISSEVARRTFWIIVCHDNLTSGSDRPASFAPLDISTRLPCDEEELAFGVLPSSPRASLPGTAAAELDPSSLDCPNRSLFCDMVVVHYLFGKVARVACSSDAEVVQPWEKTSRLSRLSQELKDFEERLPPKHAWSMVNLRGMRAKKLDLALLSTSLTALLSHIVLSRMYLPSIAAAVDGGAGTDGAPAGFWTDMASKMSQDARELLQQVETFFSYRSPSEGFPPIMVFGLFIVGDLASYALRWPQLLPGLAPFASSMVHRALDLLTSLQEAWPVAGRWATTLSESVTPLTTSSHDLSKTVAANRSLDVAEGLYRQEQDEDASLSSPSRSTAALPSPSLEIGANSLLGLNLPTGALPPALGALPLHAAAPPFPPPSYPHSLPSPSSGTGASLPFPPAFGTTSLAPTPGPELMLFPDLGADLASFLQGDVQPDWGAEYHPDRPSLWLY